MCDGWCVAQRDAPFCDGQASRRLLSAKTFRVSETLKVCVALSS
jgi:hypothetical protein